MKKLKHYDKVAVFHDIDEEGDHHYHFYDGEKKVDLDWGQIGHVPNANDCFPHPERDIDLVLYDVLWADDP